MCTEVMKKNIDPHSLRVSKRNQLATLVQQRTAEQPSVANVFNAEIPEEVLTKQLRRLKINRDVCEKRVKKLTQAEKRKKTPCNKDKGKQKFSSVYHHQSGVDVISTIGEWLGILPTIPSDGREPKMWEIVIDQVESFLIFFRLLILTPSWEGKMLAIAGYVKERSRGDRALAQELLIWLKEFVKELPYQQQAGTLKDLSSALTAAIADYRAFQTMPMAGYVYRIMAICIGLGITNALSIKIGSREITLFAGVHENIKNTYHFGHLVEAVLELAEHFLSSVVACIETGSYRPLIYQSLGTAALDIEFSTLHAAFKLNSAGNLEHCEIKTEADLLDRAEKFLEKAQIVLGGLKASTERTLVHSKYTFVYSEVTLLKASMAGGKMRIAPYTILLWGPSSVGKSYITNRLANDLLVVNGYGSLPAHERTARIATINVHDAYDTSVKSNILAYIIDDMGSSDDKGKNGMSLVDRWITMSNNTTAVANKAAVGDKGTTIFNHMLQIGTANTQQAGLESGSTFKIAGARRGTRDEVKLKPEFCRSGTRMLDVDKVPAGVPYPDMYLFTIRTAVPLSSDVNADRTGSYEFKVLEAPEFFKDGRKQLMDLDYKTYIEYHIWASQRYFKQQKNAMKQTEKLNVATTFCKKCNTISHLCNCVQVQAGETRLTWTQRCLSWMGYDPLSSIPVLQQFPDPGVIPVEIEVPSDYNLAVEMASRSTDLYNPPDSEVRSVAGEGSSDNDSIEEESDDDSVVVSVSRPMNRTCGSILASECSDYTPHAGVFSARGVARGVHQATYATRAFMSQYYYQMRASLEDFAPYHGYLTALIPDAIFNHAQVQNVIVCQILNHLNWNYRPFINGGATTATLFFVFFCSLLPIWSTFFMMLATPLFFVLWRACLIRYVLYVAVQRISVERDFFVTGYTRTLKSGLKCVAGAYIMWKMFRYSKKAIAMYVSQGNIAPTSMADIHARDAEPSMWASLAASPIEVSDVGIGSVADAVKRYSKNLVYVSVERDGKVMYCNGLMLKTFYMLFPRHMLFDDACVYRFRMRGDNTGGQWRARISSKDAVFLGTADYVVVGPIGGGQFSDITKHFPISTGGSGKKYFGYMLHKQRNGELLQHAKPMRCEIAHVKCPTLVVEEFDALQYSEMPFTSFQGLCGSIVFADYSGYPIVGLHVGGKEGLAAGIAEPITQSLINEGLTRLLEKHEFAVTPVEANVVPVEVYGTQYGNRDLKTISEKHPIRFIPAEMEFSAEVVGSCTGQVKATSKATKTIISETVARVLDSPNIYGPPNFSAGHFWRDNLLDQISPSVGPPLEAIDYAYRDYLATLENGIPYEVMREEIKPLTDFEVVNGRKGKRFIERMKSYTSAGYPLNKPKSHFMIFGEDGNADFEPLIWEEVRRLETLYLNGKCANPVFKSCAKDEPKKITSKKVRVFQAAPVHFQILVRKYFLPVVRVLSLYPLVSECAVGINALSDEWDQLVTHIKSQGDHRCLAGDYAKYDVSMPTQLTMAAFKVLIDLAAKSGNYTEVDLQVMRGIMTDTILPVLAHNGVLVKLAGTNPSGQNLTVYINSMVNSLLYRCAFFEKCGDKPFAHYVRLTTYGDDSMAGVSGAVNFSCFDLSEKLATYGFKVTPPDKSEQYVKGYFDFAEVDFLKRRSAYNEDLGHEVGLLDLESLYKSLHCQLKSKSVTPKTQVTGAMESALNEIWYHGRDVYTLYQVKFIQIAEEHAINTDVLGRSYDEWLQRKQGGEIMDPIDMEEFE